MKSLLRLMLVVGAMVAMANFSFAQSAWAEGSESQILRGDVEK